MLEAVELVAVPDDGAGQPFGLLEELTSHGVDELAAAVTVEGSVAILLGPTD